MSSGRLFLLIACLMGAAAAFLPWAQSVFPVMAGESGVSMGIGWISLIAFLACAIVIAMTRAARSPVAARVTSSAVGTALLLFLGAFALAYGPLWRAAGVVDHPYLDLSARDVETSLAIGWYASFASAACLAASGALRTLWR
jgi:hypothetical protein